MPRGGRFILATQNPRWSGIWYNEPMDAEQRLLQTIPADVKLEKVKIGEFMINYATAGSGPPVLLIHSGNVGELQLRFFRTVSGATKTITRSRVHV